MSPCILESGLLPRRMSRGERAAAGAVCLKTPLHLQMVEGAWEEAAMTEEAAASDRRLLAMNPTNTARVPTLEHCQIPAQLMRSHCNLSPCTVREAGRAMRQAWAS